MRIAFLILLLATTRAHAAVFFEPGLGYEAGQLTETFNRNARETSSGGGLTFGAKAGLESSYWMIGALYERGRMARAGDPADAGVLMGIAIPAGIQAWLGYLFSAKTSNEKGTGFALGLGIPALRYLYLNTEYVRRKYDRYTGTQFPGASFSGGLNTFRITVSLPLSY